MHPIGRRYCLGLGLLWPAASCFDPADAPLDATSMTEGSPLSDTGAQTGTPSAPTTDPDPGTTAASTTAAGTTTASPSLDGSSGAPMPTTTGSTVGEATAAGDDSSGGGPPADPCAVVPVIQSTMIDTFENGDTASHPPDGRTGYWYAYAWGPGTLDAVADPPFDAFDLTPGGYGDSLYAAGMTVTNVMGLPAPDYSGFGMEVSLNVVGEQNCAADASEMTGVRFWARGNTTLRLQVIIPSEIPVDDGGECTAEMCYDHPTLAVDLYDEWTEYTLEFSRMAFPSGAPGQLDPSRVIALSWVIDVPEETTPDQVLEVQIDDVRFVE